MSTFKISTLFVSAFVLGVSITNTVYFNRLYKSALKTPQSNRAVYFGANAVTNARIMWWLNLILAIFAGLLFLFTIFKLANIGTPKSTTPATVPTGGTTVTMAAPTVQL
jgi:hypothetical protein